MKYKDNNVRWVIKCICKIVTRTFVLLALFTLGYYVYCRNFSQSVQLFFIWTKTDDSFFMFARILSGVLAISSVADD